MQGYENQIIQKKNWFLLFIFVIGKMKEKTEKM